METIQQFNQDEKTKKTSIRLSETNVKWLKDHHINVTSLIDSLVTEYRKREETKV
jgi:hypothetical protein